MDGTEHLPAFTYHPDPVKSGAIEASTAACECCGRARGYRYACAVYAASEIKAVCPWCIADGSLNHKFGATLADDHYLRAAGISDAIVEEVTCRTPGYICWQSENWLTCCDDACEFHGDAPCDELRGLDDAGLSSLSEESGFLVSDLRDMIKDYEPGGSPAFYKFVCRHCRRTRYCGDCD